MAAPCRQNLLPVGHNRDRLARERGCAPDDEFELLAAAGHDLMGALEVEPVPAQEGVPDVVRYWHTTQGLDVLEPGFVEYPVEDAASLPGVVTKFSAVQDGRRYLVKRRGAAGTVLLKLPTPAHPAAIVPRLSNLDGWTRGRCLAVCTQRPLESPWRVLEASGGPGARAEMKGYRPIRCIRPPN